MAGQKISKTALTLFESFESGKKRFLRYDLNALSDFEQEVGMGFPQLMMSRAIFAATRAMLWSGLKWQDRTITVEGAGDLIQKYLDVVDGADVSDVLGACMKAAQDQGAIKKPKKDKDDEDDEVTPKNDQAASSENPIQK